MDSSDCRSSLERFMSNGLLRGIGGDYPPDTSVSDYVTAPGL